jgi:hypothetical protein
VGLKKDQLVALDGKGLPEALVAILNDVSTNPFAAHPAFSAKVYFSLEATSKTNSDIHKLVDYSSLPDGLTPETVVIKKVSQKKLTQDQLVSKVNKSGFPKLSKRAHFFFWTSIWKTAAIRNKKASEFGEDFNGWGWFEDKWLPKVLEHCQSAGNKFK